MNRREFVAGVGAAAVVALAPPARAVTIDPRTTLPVRSGFEHLGCVPRGTVIQDLRAYVNGILVLTDHGPFLWDGQTFELVAAVKGTSAVTVTEMYWTEIAQQHWTESARS